MTGCAINDPDLERLIEQDHQASTAFCNGDAGPKLALYSRADDATLANPDSDRPHSAGRTWPPQQRQRRRYSATANRRVHGGAGGTLDRR